MQVRSLNWLKSLESRGSVGMENAFPNQGTWLSSFLPQYVRGSDPVLKLLDDSGNIAEELSILKWNTDSVEEFLSEKLERL